jgi:3-oxoacyl-[acyl-carrier-protein] synthase II
VIPPSDSRIFVTGAGLVTPLGLDAAANARALRAEQQAFRPVTLFDVSRRVARTAAEVDLPQETLFARLPRRRQHLADRGTHMLLLALVETLASAGLASLQGVDVLVVGTSAGAMPLGQEYFRQARRSPHRLPGQVTRVQFYQPWRQMRLMTEEFDWRGPVRLVSNACASGANAIGEAMAMIRSGRARRVLAGGYDALAELVFAGFDSLRALAPDGVPRPFDAARDGLAIGEGAALVLLESADAAAERGAVAWAEAAGYATATDLHHLTQPDPQGRAALRTMAGACAMAGLSPGKIDYLNSHGTGTPHNDVAEAMAIRAWAGADAARIAVSSTKSAMGHLLGGAGAVEAVISLLALRDGWLPASLNVREPDPAVCFDLVRHFREAPLRAVLTNSFGFGGTNASLVFRSADAALPRPAVLSPAPVLRVAGLGAVSPAGWSLAELTRAVQASQPLPIQDCPRTIGPRNEACPVRRVPLPPPDRLPKSPRLRRASPVSKFALAAALEALEQAGFPGGAGAGRLGLVVGMFNGCVQFSGRFYQEVLDTPELASPLLFPETVYNAPASHIAAQLGADGPVSTLLGDASVILDAVELAGLWLAQGLVDRCLVLAAEECDWLGAEAVRYHHRNLLAGEGAAALLLSVEGEGPRLAQVIEQPVRGPVERAQALAVMAKSWRGSAEQVVDGRCGVPFLDRDETAALAGAVSVSPGPVLGECLGASGALQMVLAASVAAGGHSAAALLSGAQEAVRGLRFDSVAS